MSVPPQHVVEPILERIKSPVVEAVLLAWSDWMKSGFAGEWTKRGRANFIWEQFKAHVRQPLLASSEAKIIEHNNTLSYLIGDTVLFRFKMTDTAGLTKNYPTQLALSFHDHDEDLFGLPSVLRVEVCYNLNKLETEIRDVIVVGRDGDAVVWSYSLLDAGEGVVSLPMPAPIAPTSPSERPAARLVKPRQTGADGERKKRD